MKNSKFRAKVDTGKFIYGGLVVGESGRYYIFQGYDIEPKDNDCKSVIPETIGKSIGYTDINKIEIFEFDICKYYNRIGVIQYSKECPQFILLSEGQEFKIDKFVLKEIMVIGNIQDNPELLK